MELVNVLPHWVQGLARPRLPRPTQVLITCRTARLPNQPQTLWACSSAGAGRDHVSSLP